MANLPIRLVCNECYENLEWQCVEGVSQDTIYVEPCRTCAAKSNNNNDASNESASETQTNGVSNE